jgi:hypothetical protein
MTNQKSIVELKNAAFCPRGKANELIKRANIPWEVLLPDGFGDATVNYSDTKISIDLSQASTVTFVACDGDGQEFLITTVAL